MLDSHFTLKHRYDEISMEESVDDRADTAPADVDFETKTTVRSIFRALKKIYDTLSHYTHLLKQVSIE